MTLEIFDYSSPIKVFEKLKREWDRLQIKSTDEDSALNFCLTAWSLADWVFYDRFPTGTERDKGIFRTDVLFSRCEELKIMHDISNGVKHFKLSRPKSSIQSIESHEGSFDRSFDFSFDVSHIKIKFDDGEELILNEVIDTVFKFWKEFLGVRERSDT